MKSNKIWPEEVKDTMIDEGVFGFNHKPLSPTKVYVKSSRAIMFPDPPDHKPDISINTDEEEIDENDDYNAKCCIIM